METCVQGLKRETIQLIFQRPFKYSIIVSAVAQRMSFDGAKRISMLSNHFGSFNILMMKGSIKEQIVFIHLDAAKVNL